MPTPALTGVNWAFLRFLGFKTMRGGSITRPSWLNAVALASGALLCLNRRTVCAALRAMDGAADKGFSRFHRFLSCAQWSGLQGAKILLGLLQKAFVPDDAPLV